jgi:uncharacterized cupin superfamily protein
MLSVCASYKEGNNDASDHRQARPRGGAGLTPSEASPSFSHAPLSYFALEKLTPKGRRKNVDNGDPHDRSRPLVKVGTASVGSWHCTEGVWDSAAPRPTTESFYVLTGEASVTELDGTRHSFGPGDTVVLPQRAGPVGGT